MIMARKGQNIAALAALLGAGALASRGRTDLGDVEDYSAEDKETFKRAYPMKKGGYVKKADGCCQRGKTRGKFV